MAYLAVGVAVALGIVGVLIVVARARADRDFAGLDGFSSPLAHQRTRRTKAGRDEATRPSVQAIRPQARVSVWDDTFI